jgi:hypothetical protein
MLAYAMTIALPESCGFKNRSSSNPSLPQSALSGRDVSLIQAERGWLSQPNNKSPAFPQLDQGQ